jgi:hypothetical protein
MVGQVYLVGPHLGPTIAWSIDEFEDTQWKPNDLQIKTGHLANCFKKPFFSFTTFCKPLCDFAPKKTIEQVPYCVWWVATRQHDFPFSIKYTFIQIMSMIELCQIDFAMDRCKFFSLM